MKLTQIVCNLQVMFISKKLLSLAVLLLGLGLFSCEKNYVQINTTPTTASETADLLGFPIPGEGQATTRREGAPATGVVTNLVDVGVEDVSGDEVNRVLTSTLNEFDPREFGIHMYVHVRDLSDFKSGAWGIQITRVVRCHNGDIDSGGSALLVHADPQTEGARLLIIKSADGRNNVYFWYHPEVDFLQGGETDDVLLQNLDCISITNGGLLREIDL